MEELSNRKSLKAVIHEHLEKAATAGIENPVVFELPAQLSHARNLYQAVCGKPIPPDTHQQITVPARRAIDLLRQHGFRAGKVVADWIEEPDEDADLWVVSFDLNGITTKAFAYRWWIFKTWLHYMWLDDTEPDYKRSMEKVNQITVGKFNGVIIENAGNHLLSLLQRDGVVRFSRFFNDIPGTHDELVDILYVEGRDFDPDWAPCYMDLAVRQLEGAGLVKTTDTDDKLIDGNSDFTIQLTEEGREYCQIGNRVRYHGEDRL